MTPEGTARCTVEDRGMSDSWKPTTSGNGLYGVAGIYAIRHVPSGRTLICSTRNLGKRLWDEIDRLRKGQHFNSALHRDLQRDGADAFELLLVTTSRRPDLLKNLKQYYTSKLRHDGLTYNVRTGSTVRPYQTKEPAGPFMPLTPRTPSKRDQTNGLLDVLDKHELLTFNGRRKRAEDLIDHVGELMRSLCH